MSRSERVDEKYEKSLDCNNYEKLLHCKNDENHKRVTTVTRFISNIEKGPYKNDDIYENGKKIVSTAKIVG